MLSLSIYIIARRLSRFRFRFRFDFRLRCVDLQLTCMLGFSPPCESSIAHHTLSFPFLSYRVQNNGSLRIGVPPPRRFGFYSTL